MRLIDADALMDFYLARPTEEFSYDRRFTAEDVALRIKSAPTADTVKHGHWNEYSSYSSCSVCRSAFNTTPIDPIIKLSVMFTGDKPGLSFNYCPNCGAKLDEVVRCSDD